MLTIQENKKLGAACVVLILYFFFEYIRPQMPHLLGFLRPLKIPMFLTIALFIIFLKNEKSLLKDRLVVYMCLFVFLVGFSVTYAVNTYHVWETFRGLATILFTVVLVMPVICSESARLTYFIYAWIFFNFLLAIHSMVYTGHGPGGFLWDENDLALALNMCIPVSYYLMLSRVKVKKGKYLFMATSLVLIIGSGATMSRGGFLGLVAVFGMIWLMSERKFKHLGIVILCTALAGYPVYKLIPESYKAEMSTITDKRDSTRASRMEFWSLGWDMFKENPVLGVGAGNFPWTINTFQMRRPDFDPDRVTLYGGRTAHSLYFTLIPELGLAGIILFFLMLKQIFARLRRIISLGREYESLTETGLIAKGLLVSLVAYLITGAFISVLYYPPFWYLIAFVLTLERVANAQYTKIASEEKDAPKSDSRNRNGRAWRRREHHGAGRSRFAKRV